MILTPHAIVGAAIVNLFPAHPIIGTGLAVASHYLLDAIPHTDYDLSGLIDTESKTLHSIWENTKAIFSLLLIALDFSAAIFLCLLIFVHNDQTLMLTALGALAGMLPDALQFFYTVWKKQPFTFFQKLHDFFHHPDKMEDNIFLGTLLQVCVVVVVLILYFFLR